jgi:hypothetical protein
MYSRAEASRIKHAFWTAFGRYISPIPSSEGLKINWINYHTGFKHLYFRMEADKKKASIAIEIAHPDRQQQEVFFERFMSYKAVLEDALGESWTWDLHETDESGRIVSRIYKEIQPVNVLAESDWPKLISFFKPRIIALDAFWNVSKEMFEDLRWG